MSNVGWKTGLCDCFSSCSSCVLTCICPCYVFGRIAVIADNGQKIPGYGPCQACCYFATCSMCFCCCYSGYYRSKMRERVRLERDSCPDCLAHVCCMCCALCQEYRQLEILGYDMATGRYRNQGNNAMGPNQVMQAPTTPDGMQAPTAPGGMTGDNHQSMSTLDKIKLLLEFINCISGSSN